MEKISFRNTCYTGDKIEKLKRTVNEIIDVLNDMMPEDEKGITRFEIVTNRPFFKESARNYAMSMESTLRNNHIDVKSVKPIKE